MAFDEIVELDTVHQTQGYLEAFKCGNVSACVGTLTVSGGTVDVYETNKLDKPTSIIGEMQYSQTLQEGNHVYTKPFRWVAFVANAGTPSLTHFQLIQLVE